jgi:hypothetical protein
MPKFPNWGVGTDVNATNLANGIPNIVTKASANPITSNATLANDTELQNIALGVGTWEIEVDLWISGNGTGATGGYKDAWAFTTGTLTGTPNRSIVGPTTANAVLATGAVTLQTQVLAYNASASYGLLTGQAYWIRQMCPNFVVATAGSLAIQVAQGTSNATSTTVNIGSRVKVRQIA